MIIGFPLTLEQRRFFCYLLHILHTYKNLRILCLARVSRHFSASVVSFFSGCRRSLHGYPFCSESPSGHEQAYRPNDAVEDR